MVELYKRMGFFSNPFSRFSAEEEIDYLAKIYHKPKYFSVLLDEIKGNNSRIIFGDRGAGKSALMVAVKNKVEESGEAKDFLLITIDDYSYLLASSNNIEKKWVILLIRNLLKSLLPCLLQKDKNLFDKTEREKLSFIVTNFYQTISKSEFERICGSYKTYNEVVNPALNTVINAGVAITSDLISKSLGLPSVDKDNFYKDYFPKIDVAKKAELLNLEFFELLQILNDAISLCNKAGFKSIVFFMDKIDEDTQMGGKIKQESIVLTPILLNTKILLDNKFCLIFLLWSKIRDELNRNSVRLDKIKSIDVTWESSELRKIIEKRVEYFSTGKTTLNGMFLDLKDIDKLLYLANGSPRDLLRVLSAIYDEEENSPNSAGIFSTANVTKAIFKFLLNYDFYSVYPSQDKSRQDIKSIIAKLKKINKISFKAKDLISTFKFSQPASVSYIKVMKDFGVIKEDQEITGKEKQYSIVDPKVEYIVKYQI